VDQRKPLTKKFLKEHYIDLNKTAKEIEEETGWKTDTIIRTARRMGIHKRKMISKGKILKRSQKGVHVCPIIQTTKEGVFLNMWDSQCLAIESLDLDRASLYRTLTGDQKVHKSYGWYYVESFKNTFSERYQKAKSGTSKELFGFYEKNLTAGCKKTLLPRAVAIKYFNYKLARAFKIVS
jgi:predicted HicB family RNase H-like nuclease